MQRLIDLFCQQTIRLNSEEDVRRFHADFELIEVQAIEMINMTHGRFQQRLRRRFAILFLQIFFQRSGVNANTDRNVFIARTVNHHANTLFITDIARVNTQTIDAVFRYFQRNAIVEVDVSHQRHVNLLFDEFERFCRVHRRYGYTDDISANAFQRLDLIDRCFDVCRTRIGHGLYGDGSTIANRHIPNVNTC